MIFHHLLHKTNHKSRHKGADHREGKWHHHPGVFLLENRSEENAKANTKCRTQKHDEANIDESSAKADLENILDIKHYNDVTDSLKQGSCQGSCQYCDDTITRSGFKSLATIGDIRTHGIHHFCWNPGAKEWGHSKQGKEILQILRHSIPKGMLL